ncbi:MAG: hydroxymethylglutaryl-CoA reductase, degradative [Thermoplasmata archaeon]|nr:hydroxymethylglutaryl-CoA reductase, degradative [Thermoplasmata archaeon]
MKTSRIQGFYKLSPEERLKHVKDFADLTDEECAAISNTGAMPMNMVDRMIENVVGTFELPLGIATNFQVNGKDYLIPMAIEEPSVVAAASNAAKKALLGGGFRASSTDPVMIGQIQLTGVKSPFGAKMDILSKKEEILKLANDQDPVLVKFGGGARDIDVRVIDTLTGPMVITHLLVDTRDAMGANAVNTMAEAVAPYLEKLTGGRVYLRIISNLAVHRLARARAVWKKEELGGEEVVDGIIRAYSFAAADPFRAATHNKGIMNGISALVRATGNDTRAVEAGAHAYAAVSGRYLPLTTYEKDENGDLVGTIEIPVAVGLIGGATKVHPVAKAAVKILGIKTANELGEAMASLGLAQNLAALRALATEGIQRGHMKLHARNLAVTAGATPDILNEVVVRMIKEKAIRMDVAERIIKELKGE